MRSGVYIITNLINGKNYIGESYYIIKRLGQHKNALIKGKHFNIHLQSSFNKYGIENFSFSILELCDESLTKEKEDYWCTILKTHNDKFGYNIRLTDKEKMGKLSESTKLKLSLAHKGKLLSISHRLSLSKAQLKRGKNQFRSEEAINRISTANINRSKAVIQYSLNNEMIDEYPSRKIASEKTKVHYSAICNCTLNIAKTAGNYIWKFKTNL